MAYVTGDRDIDRRLNDLEKKTAQKVLRAGVNAGLTELGKALRAAVNASFAPARVKSQARKTIGKRFKRQHRSDAMTAKAGFAVGKKNKAVVRDGRKGVGISPANVHWFVLGTKERRTKKGHNRGDLPALLEGVTEEAVASVRGRMVQAARQAMIRTIERSVHQTAR